MENLDLILTLTGGLAAALAFGLITQRLGLSPIVGYLLAGIAVGPHTPGFVGNRHYAEQLAEVGVILLMFGVGLHFHVRELLAVRRVAIPGAVVQSLTATALGIVAALSFGWSAQAGVVFGVAISVASTVVLVRVLSDNRDLHTPTGHIAVGWLVVEDLFTVIVLVLLPTLSGGKDSGFWSLPSAVGIAVLKIGALTAMIFLVGGRAIPWLLKHVADTRSRELFTLTILVVALGIAVGAANLFGVSMALGAFLAGMVVGRSEFSLRAATEALPMRDAFAVLFFVSVGMLFDPAQLLAASWQVAATLAIIVIGKPVAAFIIVLALRYQVKVALAVSCALSQIGEFSFMLAILGIQVGALPNEAMNTIVAASIITITLNPVLYRLIDPVESRLQRLPRLWRALNLRVKATAGPNPGPEQPASASSHRIIVVGYGPVGQILTRLLRENDIDPTVIELNLDTVNRVQADGHAAVYGDALHRETLQKAGVESAFGLILTPSGLKASQEIIRIARELNPGITVLARTAYVREIPGLRRAGAQSVFSGEGEVAVAMSVAVLRELGATPEQIDRERERISVESFVTIGNGAAGPQTTG
jgi:monovalent cation:H+ antiporter-2, CPA2 family